MPERKPLSWGSKFVVLVMVITFFIIVYLQVMTHDPTNGINSIYTENNGGADFQSEEIDLSIIASDSVDVKPEIIGGIKALHQYIEGQHLFPERAQQLGISGSSTVSFVIDDAGNLQELILIDEEPPGYGFGDASLKALKAMKFNPGEYQGKRVAVRMEMIVKFKAV